MSEATILINDRDDGGLELRLDRSAEAGKATSIALDLLLLFEKISQRAEDSPPRP